VVGGKTGVEHPASHLVQIRDFRVQLVHAGERLLMMQLHCGHGCHVVEPLEFAVANEGITTQKKFWRLWKNSLNRGRYLGLSW
jgi:hypothetical protein